MGKMTREDYEQLVELLDGRIDELTKPIPSRQILRFAEAIRSADGGDENTDVTYSEEDYENLRQAHEIVNELLPSLLEKLRAKSINPETGWKIETVSAGNGDNGLCAICHDPYQHFGKTVKVHTLDMHPNAFHSVCRDCIRQYSPSDFVEDEEIDEWLQQNEDVCDQVEDDVKREGQRIDLIDAIRRHAHLESDFGDIVQNASGWANGAFGEWG
jgi:hypothetical protein